MSGQPSSGTTDALIEALEQAVSDRLANCSKGPELEAARRRLREALCVAQRTLIGAPSNDQLSQLWNAIVTNTKGDGFWIGEILLTVLEREVGFNPSAVSSTDRGTGA